MLGIEGEWIGLRKPSGHCGNQGGNELFAHIHESQAGRAQQIFESSRHIKIQVHCLHVNWPSAAILVIIKHDQSAGIVSELSDSSYLGTKSVLEANMRERHDQRVAVDHPFVV